MASGGWIDYDAVYGTDTGGKLSLDGLTIASANRQYGTGYQRTPPQRLHQSVSFLGIDPADFTFVDLGCGKGITLMTASSLGFASVVGVEFAKELVDIAQGNLAKAGIPNVSVLHGDAADFEFPVGNLIVYLYNPFRLPVLERVVERLRKLTSKVYVIFTRCHYKEFLDSTGFLIHIGGPTGDSQVDIWRVSHDPRSASDLPRSIIRREVKAPNLAASMQYFGLREGLRTLCIGAEGEAAHNVVRALQGISRHLVVLEWRTQAIDALLRAFGTSITVLTEPWPQDGLIRNLDLVVNNLEAAMDLNGAEHEWQRVAPALRRGGAFATRLREIETTPSPSITWPTGGWPYVVEVTDEQDASGSGDRWLVVTKDGSISRIPARPTRPMPGATGVEAVPARWQTEPGATEHASRPELLISIDVEAFPRRATEAPVDRLIWGRHPDGESGLLAMMRIAEKHAVPLTMYLDFAESDLHGAALIDVAKEIDRRGHDLELHCHAEFIPESVWQAAGIRRAGLSVANERQCGVILDYLCDHYGRACSSPPVSYRGGAYRFNASMIRALAARGIRVLSNYNASRPDVQPLRKGLLRQFYWSNGCLELPISHMPANRLHASGGDTLVPFNFNVSSLDSPERLKSFLDAFYASQPADVAVLMMHSWSFGKLPGGQSEYYDFFLPDFVERFDNFLELIRNDVRVVTARDIARRVGHGKKLSNIVEDLDELPELQPLVPAPS